MQRFHRVVPDYEFVFHIRNHSPAKRQPKNPLPQPLETRGVTVAVLMFGRDGYYGIALCNALDDFNRKIGRAIATGRAKKARERRVYGEHSARDAAFCREREQDQAVRFEDCGIVAWTIPPDATPTPESSKKKDLLEWARVVASLVINEIVNKRNLGANAHVRRAMRRTGWQGRAGRWITERYANRPSEQS